MNRDQAIARIKKCLALSKSANEHEAAAALRQAQKLMREHEVDGEDITLADVREHSTPARSAAATRWESLLASTVADAFGCEYFSATRLRIGAGARLQREVVFVGVDAAPQLAAYAHQVLLRQCAKARMAHVGAQPRACKQVTKTARGDAFAWGWVLAVRELVERFAGRPGDQALIESYIARHHPDLRTVKPRDTTIGRNVRDADKEAGWSAGKRADLKHGIGAAAAPGLIGGQP